MFARIMAVVLAAILLTTIGLSAVWYITLRNQQIDARLDYLISEAQDIAYLASNYNDSSDIWNYFPVYGSTTGNDMVRVIMDRKADKINREFGAYIAVVDRSSNVMDNLPAAYREDPEFVASLNSEEINSALNKIIGGETIRLRSSAGPDPTFTVGVPFTRRGFIYGAVFIQTKAQRIESGLNEILLKAGLLAAGVMLLSGVAVFLFVRGAMKPVRSLSAAAGAIAGGDFSPRLAEDKGGREMREVSRTFNHMTKTLADVEEGRREFVANVSHELRSPITSIRGFAEGMLRLCIFIGYLWAVNHLQDMKRVWMYHGAEHKTIFCYEAGPAWWTTCWLCPAWSVRTRNRTGQYLISTRCCAGRSSAGWTTWIKSGLRPSVTRRWIPARCARTATGLSR